MRKLLALVVAVAGWAMASTSSATIAYYSEVGDAGDRYHAQDLTGGPYGAISLEIGGPDVVDAFRFHLDATSGLQINNLSTSIASVLIKLFADGSLASALYAGIDSLVTGSLAAGDYVLEFNTDLLADPPMSFEIFPLDPPFVPPLLPPQTRVPEPATWALLAATLLSLALRRGRVARRPALVRVNRP